MKEFELLAELERRELVVGVEHDAARIDGLVVTQDTLVEGVHFRFDLVSWRELGARAAAVNLSDLAASGADPIPPRLPAAARPKVDPHEQQEKRHRWPRKRASDRRQRPAVQRP